MTKLLSGIAQQFKDTCLIVVVVFFFFCFLPIDLIPFLSCNSNIITKLKSPHNKQYEVITFTVVVNSE